MRVFVDTSALLALLDEDDVAHAEASATFRGLLPAAELVTTNYVEVEAIALVRRRLGPVAATRLVDALLPAIATIWVDPATHRLAATAVRLEGAASFVDEVSFATMRDGGIETAFAFDTDFTANGFKLARAPAGPDRSPRIGELAAEYGASTAVGGDLVGVAEIAGRSNRSINTIQSWRRRHGSFPPPVADLAAGPIWTWPAVAAWIAGRSGSPSGSRPVGLG